MIALAIWVCLYPVSMALTEYIDAKRFKITGKETHNNVRVIMVVINIIIWSILGVYFLTK